MPNPNLDAMLEKTGFAKEDVECIAVMVRRGDECNWYLSIGAVSIMNIIEIMHALCQHCASHTSNTEALNRMLHKAVDDGIDSVVMLGVNIEDNKI